jgi:hypothetical protein
MTLGAFGTGFLNFEHCMKPRFFSLILLRFLLEKESEWRVSVSVRFVAAAST